MVYDHHAILPPLLSPTNSFLMDYSCLTQDQVIKFPLTPGATLSFTEM